MHGRWKEHQGRIPTTYATFVASTRQEAILGKAWMPQYPSAAPLAETRVDELHRTPSVDSLWPVWG
jgi:hypothetical protein